MRRPGGLRWNERRQNIRVSVITRLSNVMGPLWLRKPHRHVYIRRASSDDESCSVCGEFDCSATRRQSDRSRHHKSRHGGQVLTVLRAPQGIYKKNYFWGDEKYIHRGGEKVKMRVALCWYMRNVEILCDFVKGYLKKNKSHFVQHTSSQQIDPRPLPTYPRARIALRKQ